MNASDEFESLNIDQLRALEQALHEGSAEASTALAKWIGKASLVEIDALEQIALEEATSVLAQGDDAICFCILGIEGPLHGEMILAFDDACGLALADMLLDQPAGTSSAWEEMEVSAALETANIVCSAYLNALSRNLTNSENRELLPTPPRFHRDFPESLLEFALIGQAIASDEVIFALTRFEIDSVSVNWTLLFVPDAQTRTQLPHLLAGRAPE